MVIGDAKRGDIGISAAHYATGGLAVPPYTHYGEAAPDALTINPYFGVDGIDPFVDEAKRTGKGVFTLVRTSNPGGDEVQALKLADGGTVADAVAKMVRRIGAGNDCVGRRGYSLLGAVVGATKTHDGARLRELMPEQIFLVPGVGVQGGRLDELSHFFRKDGTGALIAASRSIIYPYEPFDGSDWLGDIESATVKMKNDLRQLIGV